MDAHCAKCGSQKIIPLVRVMKHGLMAHVGFTNPEARMFKGPEFAHFRATICRANRREPWRWAAQNLLYSAVIGLCWTGDFCSIPLCFLPWAGTGLSRNPHDVDRNGCQDVYQSAA